MEVNFNISLDFGKNKRDEKNKSNGIVKNCNCKCEESNLEKCLDMAQKIIKTVKVK